jgi:hypothetical protein
VKGIAMSLDPTPEERLKNAGARTFTPPDNVQPLKAMPNIFSFEYPDEIKTPDISWLVYGLLPASGAGFLYGPTGSRKTFLAIDMGCRLALGMPVLGHDAEDPAGVIYIAAEDAEGVRVRVQAWKQHHGIDERFPFVVVPHAPNALDENDIEKTRRTVREIAQDMEAKTGIKARLIIVDTLSQCSAGANTNEAATATMQLRTFNQCAADIGGSCMVIHHPGKDRDRGMAGALVYLNNANFALSVDPDEIDAELSTITTVKIKNGRVGKQYAVRLSAEIEVGQDTKGRPITSCVAIQDDVPDALPKSQKLSPALEVMFEGVRAAIDKYGQEGHLPEAGGVTLYVTRANLRQRMLERDMLATNGDAKGDAKGDPKALTAAARNKLYDAITMLRSRGMIGAGENNGPVWLTTMGKRYSRDKFA